ncbi:CapA family protein [Natronomonas sp. EA1]|uniref:CapA family protein n=1 Tax=Natronomonas sp. EA1 TaxID=3421655 RepID=UPI003EB8E384
MQLGLAGDVMFGRLVDRAMADREPAAVWGDLLPDLQALDGFLCNLECVLSTRGEPYTGAYHPYHFRADPAWAIPALEAAGVSCVTLANNHVLDFGPEALRDTLDALEAAGIPYAGVGDSPEEAFAPVAFEAGDCRVAVVAATDNTPAFAANGGLGTAYVDIENDPGGARTAMRAALDRAWALDPDLVVVSLHWGPNMRTAPSEAFRSFARFLHRVGADVVVGHSAHLFQGIEVGRGLTLYDTGDFVDDYAVDPGLRNDRSFLFVLDTEAFHLRAVPTEIYDCAVHHATEEGARWACDRLADRSAAFDTVCVRTDDGLVVPLHPKLRARAMRG